MKQGKYRIKSNAEVADKVWRMELLGDTSALLKGGQFVDVAVDGYYLRRPIAAQKWDADGFVMFYKVVGGGTDALSREGAGVELDVLTGLGNGFDASLCGKKALVVSGGLGASPLFSLVSELVGAGREVTVVLGFNRACDAILVDEYLRLGAEVHVATMDGSLGAKGLVTDVIRQLDGGWDCFYTCGPKVMMKAVCEMLELPGQASLEERMGCGCGICYGCTCHTKNGPRRICADGPVFMKEDIIW